MSDKLARMIENEVLDPTPEPEPEYPEIPEFEQDWCSFCGHAH